jgi:formate/nitrite transporter FocA (FNT family)
VSARPPHEIWEESLDEGERRLDRRLPGLAATAFAGGADVLFGVIVLSVTAGALAAVLPESLAHVIAAATFGIGFAFITLGRAELFTENFLIPVGAVYAGRASVRALLRMWLVTLVLNFVGLALFAAVFSVKGVLTPEALTAAGKGADVLTDRTFLPALLSAIAAGTVMTLFTWVVAAADSSIARIAASLLVGFVLIAPSLNHAVVGFGEVVFAQLAGTASSDLGDLVRNTAIAIAGNLIGGVGLVFSIRLAQVRSEPGTRSGGKDEAAR